MKNQLKQFRLKNEYFTSVDDNKYMELRDLFKRIIFKGKSFGTKDHPEFTKLRNRLCKLGYISIEHSWINGDKVLTPFKLNKLDFKKGEQFPCASALGTRIFVTKMMATKKLQKIDSL
jgi:hypothetical protein